MSGCRYLVNMNYVVDLAAGRSGAWSFAKRNKCSVCAGTVLAAELRRARARSELRRALMEAGVHWLRVAKERSRVRRLLARALALLADTGTTSINTVYDTAYILEARELGATLVTGDKAACKRAIRLGICCIYTRVKPWCEACTLEQWTRCAAPTRSSQKRQSRQRRRATRKRQPRSSHNTSTERSTRKKRRGSSKP